MLSPAPFLLVAALGSPFCLGSPAPQSIPSYVTEYAPISYLYSGESWWPADVATHLTHVKPQEDRNDISSTVDFDTIGSLTSDVYLASKDDVESQPSWMFGVQPDSTGLTSAPATIIVVNKPGGIVDAFYFYFYSYDHAVYLDLTFGDHVGDWEHSMIRFVDGTPSYVYLSAHTSGVAYTFDAFPKMNGRPVTYIALGTHANYASTGEHQHDLPLLDDQTDAGHPWDVTLNYRGYVFDNSTQTFAVANGNANGASEELGEGVGWLNFPGHWGNEQLQLLNDGQYCVTDFVDTECKYVDGPTGPIAKNLGRVAVCQDEDDCEVLSSV